MASEAGRCVDRAALSAYFTENQADFNNALVFLREINSSKWHDAAISSGDEYDLVRIIDRDMHPAYLRLVEGVLTPLLRLLAHFSRLDRGKKTDGLQLASVVEELAMGPLGILVQPYKHLVRNGIAHGGITFLSHEICYRDKKGNEEALDSHSVVRLLDDLIDTCNGMVASLKVFFAVFREHGYTPPREILIDELREESATPWWGVEGCVESQVGGASQLTVFARPRTRNYAHVQWSCVQVGILAEYFAPGYDRYFISLRSPNAYPGWAAFDGGQLRDLRCAGVGALPPYAAALEAKLIFYFPRVRLPAIIGRIGTFWTAFQLAAAETLRGAGSGATIRCRTAAAHRNCWGVVLTGSVVVEGTNAADTIQLVRKSRCRIVGSVRSAARRINGRFGAASLPLAFAQVNVFRRDYRCRRLADFGLDDDLVCTVRHQRLRRIRCGNIVGSEAEQDGKWQIMWNRAWLESSGARLR